MIIAVAAAIIQDGKILLVRKGDYWILPGGKKEKKETDVECLIREIGEELPGAIISDISTNIELETIDNTPHTGKRMLLRVYFAKLSGSIQPAAEISEAVWTSSPQEYNLPSLTATIIKQLRACGYMR